MTNIIKLKLATRISVILLSLGAFSSHAISLPSYEVIVSNVNKGVAESEALDDDIEDLFGKVRSCRLATIESGLTGEALVGARNCEQAQAIFSKKVFDYQNTMALGQIKSDLKKYLERGVIEEDDLWYFYAEYVAERTLFEQYVNGAREAECQSAPIAQYGPRRVTDCQVLDKTKRIIEAVKSEATDHFTRFLINADWIQLKSTDPELWCSESVEVSLPLTSPCTLYSVKQLIDSIEREPIAFIATSLPVVNTAYAKLPPFPVRGANADVDKDGVDDVVQRYILHKAPYSARKQYLLGELSKSLQQYAQEGVAFKIEAVSVLKDVGSCWNRYYPGLDLLSPVLHLTLRGMPRGQRETLRKDLGALLAQAKRGDSCNLDLATLPEDQVGIEYRHLDARDVNNNGVWDDIDLTLQDRLSANTHFPSVIRNAIVRYIRAQQDLLQAAVSGSVEATLEPAIKMELCLKKLVQEVDLYQAINLQSWIYSSTHRAHLREATVARNQEVVDNIYEKLANEDVALLCR